MHPELATYNYYIREKIDQLLAELDGLSEADLNRTPDIPGANSPYVLVTHTYGNIRAWAIGIACGVEMGRDRPGEFASHGTIDHLRAAAKLLSADMERALENLDPATLGDRFVPVQELWGEGTPREMARRDCLAHVLEHAGTHLGHLHLTTALLRQGAPA